MLILNRDIHILCQKIKEDVFCRVKTHFNELRKRLKIVNLLILNVFVAFKVFQKKQKNYL
jgi:predicted negative regulator of RcsB-dependent stress response